MLRAVSHRRGRSATVGRRLGRGSPRVRCRCPVQQRWVDGASPSIQEAMITGNASGPCRANPAVRCRRQQKPRRCHQHRVEDQGAGDRVRALLGRAPRRLARRQRHRARTRGRAGGPAVLHHQAPRARATWNYADLATNAHRHLASGEPDFVTYQVQHTRMWQFFGNGKRLVHPPTSHLPGRASRPTGSVVVAAADRQRVIPWSAALRSPFRRHLLPRHLGSGI